MSGSKRVFEIPVAGRTCVFDGFDTPLASMRSVAAYFRVLSDRRSPPDPRTLRWLAEGHCADPVEVRVAADRIVLSPRAAASTNMTGHSADAPSGMARDRDATGGRGEEPGTGNRNAGPDKDDVWRLGERIAAQGRRFPPAPEGRPGLAAPGRPAPRPARTPRMSRGNGEGPPAADPLAAGGPGGHAPPVPDAAGPSDGIASPAAPGAVAARASGEAALPNAIRAIVAAPGLSRADEDELVAELAEIETRSRAIRERDAAEAAGTGPCALAAGAPRRGATDDGTLDRLLDETDAMLDDAAGRQRREAIAHLKAAASAERGEPGAPGGCHGGCGLPIARLVHDLARTLDPSDAESPGGPGGSPAARSDTRTAPLILGAELRVDAAEEAAGRAPGAERTPEGHR